MIDTRKVTDRRALRFHGVDEVLRDAESLAEADCRGTLRHTGNWELGQALAHLAFWANAPFDGYPESRRPPWILRRLLPLFKGKILNGRMPVGIRIPGTPGGTFGIEPCETAAGLAALQRALRRLAEACPTAPNPLLGVLAHQEWIHLNLRHAELHLSFFHPR